MSKNNVRIAIRDSTDSHNVAFFDNISGIRYQSANLQRFLAGSASILTIEYNSKDIDTIRTGCKLAFIYKQRAYWLNIMDLSKKGYKVEITAYSLGLELNNETRGEHKPANAMSIAEYVAYYDPEHALTIGVNEVSDKRIKLEWTGTDTILARLFSVANSFGAELDFNVELNDDYSLKRQVLNIYKKGNLGTNKVSQPVRVGKELKVINYSDNIKELRTAVRATGKDGLTIDGLNKKIYDNNKELLYYSSGMTVYAPQSRDRFPSVGKGSNDNWIVKDLGETQYETKEALWGYMYGEIQKISVPEITYEVEGAIDAGIGDTQTLIDDIHFEPALYVQARVSELEDDILTGKVTNSTFINFERKYSQIADSLLKQVEALAEDAAPYIVRLSTDNGYNFKNGQGTSTITAKLEKYSKIVNAKWKWLINNSVVSETSSVKINASQVNGTLNVVAVAIVGGNEAAREYITFTNADDGVGIKSITRYYTTNDKAEGVTAGGQNWSTKPTTPTADKKYMWSYDVITYTNDTSLVTKPAVIGARGDDGLDADTTGITEALDKAKQELTALSANIEKVRNDSLAAVEEAKQQLTTVANDLSTAKQDLTSQAQQLQAQASAQSELTKRVSTVEETANGTKTTVSELSKTVDSNTKNITSVTARTKTVEDDLTSTKTTLSQVKTTADNTSKKTATLETGLNGVKADLTATTTTADTTKTNLANYQASNDKAVANLQSNLQTANGNISSLQTKVEAVPGQISSAVSAVEGKIPTEIGSSNLLRNTVVNADNLKLFGASNSTINVATKDGHQTYKIVVSATNNSGVFFNGNAQYYNLIKDRYYTFSFWVLTNKDKSYNFNSLGHIQTINNNSDKVGNDSIHQHTSPVYSANVVKANTWTKVWCTFKATSNSYFKPYFWYLTAGDEIYIYDMMLNEGKIPLSYTPAVEDTQSDITKLNTTLTQTANGLKQLSTQVTSQGSTITSHTNSINSLTTGLSAKVSQTDFNTLSGRVTTAENNITAKANELSSKITSVEGKIPSGEMNLVEYGRPADGYSPYKGAEYATHPFYYNGAFKMYIIKNTTTSEKILGMNRFKVERNTDYTLYFKGFNNSAITHMDVWFLKRVSGSTKEFDSAQILVSGRKLSISKAEDVSVTFNTGNYDEGYIRFDNNGSETAGTQADLYFGDVSVKKGKSNNGWSPSLSELASSQDLKNAQSEIKQTTDAISASVSSLDKSTVKSASLTINTDGIVMKAGKSTTDVANAIGSYFAVNQNAINLFADKIKVKGSMIVDGAITSNKISAGAITGDKIAANSINSSKIVSSGITANVIKGGVLQSLNGSTNFELDTGKLFYNNNNTGVFRVQNGASTMGLKFSNTSISVAGTSRILSRAILGGDRRETTLDDGKWDKGGFSGIIIETIKGVDSNQNEKADAVCVVGDIISFTHTYSDDSLSAQGWRMETYSPTSSYPSNVVLKPYGINYRNSNIVVGDLRLDNGDGSGYWMRATINVLKACFGHILNGGTSSQALNAIRSELNKISGT